MPQQVFELMKLDFVFGKRVDVKGRRAFGNEFRVIDRAKHMLHSLILQLVISRLFDGCQLSGF